MGEGCVLQQQADLVYGTHGYGRYSGRYNRTTVYSGRDL